MVCVLLITGKKKKNSSSVETNSGKVGKFHPSPQ